MDASVRKTLPAARSALRTSKNTLDTSEGTRPSASGSGTKMVPRKDLAVQLVVVSSHEARWRGATWEVQRPEHSRLQPFQSSAAKQRSSLVIQLEKHFLNFVGECDGYSMIQYYWDIRWCLSKKNHRFWSSMIANVNFWDFEGASPAILFIKCPSKRYKLEGWWCVLLISGPISKKRNGVEKALMVRWLTICPCKGAPHASADTVRNNAPSKAMVPLKQWCP